MKEQTDFPADAWHRSGPTAVVLGFPDDVLGRPGMSVAEKRAVLAGWASDARAVENAPDLRRLDNGAIVGVDEILRALRSLDGADDDNRREGRSVLVRPRGRVAARWRGWHRGRDDDDDDPPPCPAAAMPVRVLRPERLAAA